MIAMAQIRYSDWDITKRHAEILRKHAPVELRHLEPRKSIPGILGTRVATGVRSGVWMKPLGRQVGNVFSCVQDVDHLSLVVLVRGTTSSQAKDIPDYDTFREWVYALFNKRRATGLVGEVYSLVETGNYDVDDSLAREWDIDIYKITSRFREDRYALSD